MNGSERSGGRILADQLRVHGTELAFLVPGESYLEVLDGLYEHQDAIRLINCRHEGAAANMAAAYGKLIGRPGICMVTRGPGATHASVGVHTAEQDSSPMILLVGQVGRPELGRDAFQEIDYRRFFGSVAKWVEQIEDVRRIPELIARAFQVASSGRPGPVVLSLPEDMLVERCTVLDAQPYRVLQAEPSPGQVERLLEIMAGAERPLVIAGGSGWGDRESSRLRSWAEAAALPVVNAFRQQDVLDNRSSSYAGDLGTAIGPELIERVRKADVILALGTRLDEMTTRAYTLIGGQRLIHVHPGLDDLDRVFPTELAITAGVGPILEALSAGRNLDGSRWSAWAEAARGEHLFDSRPQPQPGDVNLGEVMVMLRRQLPDDTVLTNGAGNFTGWIQRFFEFRGVGTQLAPQSGAMGYGVPAAIAAAAAGRRAACLAGDGDFLMYAQELGTAVQYGLKVLFMVVNNGMYGTIRMHQEREHPGRVIGTELRNPDFAALAESFGVQGQTVRRTEEFPAALERALAAPGSALIELQVSPRALTSRTPRE